MVVETREKRDWVTPVAIGLGAVGIGAGLWFFLKKPPGVPAGGTAIAHFKFDYLGGGGTYVLQVSFGKVRWIEPFFDHVEGLTWMPEVTIPSSDTYEFDVECDIPIGTTPGEYDAEALIRTPEMDWLDYLIKDVKKGAIRITE